MTIQTRFPWIVGASIVLPLLVHAVFSGSYVRQTAADRYTYWIGPVSTTLPFAIWALLALVIFYTRRSHRQHTFSAVCGYVFGWLCMLLFTLWIITLPHGPRSSSTMGIAVILTPFFHASVFPLPFIFGYLLGWLFYDDRYASHFAA